MSRSKALIRIMEMLIVAPVLMASRCDVDDPINSTYASWLPGGRIVLLRDGGGTSPTLDELFVMTTDGTSSRLLLDTLSNLDDATVSPDGTQIAVTKEGTGEHELYTVDVTSRHATHIGKGRNPRWSPDGRLIAFARVELVAGATKQYVYTTDASGARVRRVDPGLDFSWAPDSRRIAIIARHDSTSTIRVALASGSRVHTIATEIGVVGDPVWSADGHWIAFGHSSGATSSEVRVIDVETRRTRRFRLQAAPWGSAAWSPRGHRLALAGSLDSAGVAYVISLDGAPVIRLDKIKDPRTRLADPVWSPSGKRVVLVAKELVSDSAIALRIANADGTGSRLVSQLCGPDPRAEWSRDKRKLLFGSACDGAVELYVAFADGTDAMRLTWGAWMNREPAWSPDGRLTFTRFEDGRTPVLTVASSRGMDERSLFVGREASWSPDGAHIAYVNSGPKERSTYGDAWTPAPIYVADSDGSHSRPLITATWWPNDSTSADGPKWSPDGRRIVFSAALHRGTSSLYVVDLATGDPVRLTPNDTAATDPTWSPDGRRIAYAQVYDTTGSTRIWVVDAEGGHRAQISAAAAGQPAWSPDGREIAVVALSGPGIHIMIMNALTGALRRLTQTDAIDWSPAWSPDGRWIAFVSECGGNANIWLVHPDGTGLHRVTSPRARRRPRDGSSSDAPALGRWQSP